MNIGFNTWQDVGKVGVLVAGKGIATGDQQAYVKALVADVNSRGGLAGRRVVPVFYDFKTEEIGSGDLASQEACDLWTRDNPVFAVALLTAAGLNDYFMAACLQRVRVPIIEMNYMGMPSWIGKYPFLWAPMDYSWARYFPEVLQRAKARGYFGAWDTTLGQPGTTAVKIGIQTGSDNPEFVKLMTAALKGIGYTVTTTAVVNGAGDGSGAQAAVLKFQSAHVTHVIQDPQCIGGTVPFMNDAEAQHYRPRYLLHTGNCPDLLIRFVPQDQYGGAIGAGLMPAMDVDLGHDPGDPSPARARCKKVMRHSGQDPDKSRDGFAFMVFYCDAVDFLTRAIGTSDLSSAGFQHGAQLIHQLLSSSTFAISMPGGQRTGAAAVRDLAYNTECKCIVYTSGNHSF